MGAAVITRGGGGLTHIQRDGRLWSQRVAGVEVSGGPMSDFRPIVTPLALTSLASRPKPTDLVGLQELHFEYFKAKIDVCIQ